jgi:hypothetical protein
VVTKQSGHVLVGRLRFKNPGAVELNHSAFVKDCDAVGQFERL